MHNSDTMAEGSGGERRPLPGRILDSMVSVTASISPEADGSALTGWGKHLSLSIDALPVQPKDQV
jgi:hypothetical protein